MQFMRVAGVVGVVDGLVVVCEGQDILRGQRAVFVEQFYAVGHDAPRNQPYQIR